MRIHVACVFGWLTACGVAQAGDWPDWRGPEGNGISRETGLVDSWNLATKENVLWVSPVGGRATPIVQNGKIYLNCRTTHDVNDPHEKIHAREQVICRDANTGDELWRDEFNVFQTDIPAPRVGWAAMAGDPETGNVYMHSVSGIFRCYDADGNVQWEYSLFEEFGKISGYGGRTQTPVIDEDRVIVSFLCMNWGETGPPPPKHTYYAFDKRTGKLLWTAAPGGRPLDTNYSGAVVTVVNGKRMLIGGNADGGVYAMNARTGESIWGFRMSKRGLNATPVVAGNRVYISHGEDNIDSVAFGRVQCIDATGTGDVTETHSVWRVDDVKAGYTALVVNEGILFVVADTGKLHAYDANDGTELWTHNLGTVGKGSPVWADGKLYVMEVNGNVHILKPSREGCETLSHVELVDGSGSGYDEIYASPAIANGRVYLVTRDRTICLGRAGQKPTSDPVPELAAETPAEQTIASIKLVPFETRLRRGESVQYELYAYDRHGHLIDKLDPTVETQDDLPGGVADGKTLTAADDAVEQGGHVVARHGDLVATARVRIFPPLPWSWDFEGLTGRSPVATWIPGVGKLVPTPLDGGTVAKNSPGGGRPSNYVWLGPPDMTGYTIQADVLMTEERRRLPSVGITANRYNLIIKGNVGKLGIQSWAPHLRMAKEISFRSDPDVWYRMKLRVNIADGQATVQGKVWKREDAEPAEWTVEATDPHPNLTGSPGIYTYALTASLFDNVVVTKD